MGNTPIYGWPYPELTDPPDGPAQIRALGTAIEGTLAAKAPFAISAGSTPVQLTASTAGNVAVTFPLNRFTQIPLVVGAVSGGSGGAFGCYSPHASPTTSGMTLYLDRAAATTAAIPVHWIAMQMTSAAAPGLLADEGFIDRVVTCHTVGCDNAGYPITLSVPDDLTAFVCGVCGQPITDIVPS
jgi:hypothetical protein